MNLLTGASLLALAKSIYYFIDRVAGLLKSRNKKTFTSHFVFETEMMRYIQQKW